MTIGRTTMPRRQSLCDVQFNHTSPLPVYHSCGSRTWEGRGGQTRPVRCCNM